jgi:serine protease Do
VVAQLREGHQVSPAWLGGRSKPVTPVIAEALGLKEADGALVDNTSGPTLSGDTWIRREELFGNTYPGKPRTAVPVR